MNYEEASESYNFLLAKEADHPKQFYYKLFGRQIYPNKTNWGEEEICLLQWVIFNYAIQHERSVSQFVNDLLIFIIEFKRLEDGILATTCTLAYRMHYNVE